MDGTQKLVFYCDGASRGNPGPAGAGVVVQDEQGKVLRRFEKFIGNTTNNQAEYSALIMGIEDALKHSVQDAEFRLDSQLVVKQLNGEYRVRSIDLQPFYRIAKELLDKIPHHSIKHVPRGLNLGADALANKAIDGHTLL